MRVRRPYLSPMTAGKLCNSCLSRIGRMVASDWLAYAVPWYILNVAVAWQLNVAVPTSALQFNTPSSSVSDLLYRQSHHTILVTHPHNDVVDGGLFLGQEK